MPAVQLIRRFEANPQPLENPLPQLLHTPMGLAIIEIQGTIHAPSARRSEWDEEAKDGTRTVCVGRLEFPLYDGSDAEGPWTKRVYFYIGKHQRLTGELKKLVKPLVVLSRYNIEQRSDTDLEEDKLSIDAVVRYKILFSSRPEPVGS